MIARETINKNIKEILKHFAEQNCTLDSIHSFILNNLDFILGLENCIRDNLYFIYNGDNLYCVFLAFEDTYYWSLYENEKFSCIISEDKNLNYDYIVEMILHFADAEKIKRISPQITSMNIEQKIHELKKIRLNYDGYHVK